MRVKSLLQQGARRKNDTPGAILAPEEGERDLMLMLGQMPDAMEAGLCRAGAEQDRRFRLQPGADLQQLLQRNFHILTETDVGAGAVRAWHSAELVLKELELCLELLGIATPERM